MARPARATSNTRLLGWLAAQTLQRSIEPVQSVLSLAGAPTFVLKSDAVSPTAPYGALPCHVLKRCLNGSAALGALKSKIKVHRQSFLFAGSWFFFASRMAKT